MYFWKIEKLKEEISQNKFDEKDRFSYAFIYIAMTAIFMEAMSYLPVENPNIWDSVNTIGNIIITIIGTFYAYKANGGHQGTDFLGRFFSISFVVSIRFIALLIPMTFALTAYYIFTFPDEQEIVSTPLDIIPLQIWFALLYARTCKHIKDVKNS